MTTNQLCDAKGVGIRGLGMYSYAMLVSVWVLLVIVRCSRCA